MLTNVILKYLSKSVFLSFSSSVCFISCLIISATSYFSCFRWYLNKDHHDLAPAGLFILISPIWVCRPNAPTHQTPEICCFSPLCYSCSSVQCLFLSAEAVLSFFKELFIAKTHQREIRKIKAKCL